jgi:mono/diheme cytochrome c family protein
MKLFLGIVIGFLIIPFALFLFVKSGRAPVSAFDPTMPMEAFFAKMGRKSRIRAEQPRRDLSTFTTDDLQAGALVYQKECAFCHGLPNQTKPDVAKGMFPKPPQLFIQDGMVTDDPVGEDYWKVKNGIRLSGMPGFKDSLSDTEIWQVSALLAKADKLPDSLRDMLKAIGNDAPTQPPANAVTKKKKGPGHQ